MLTATALATCRPAGLSAPSRAARPARRSQLATRAMGPVEILQLAADAAPGSVDAPISAIIGGAQRWQRQLGVLLAKRWRCYPSVLIPSRLIYLPAGAIVVTGLSFALTLALKPGKASVPPWPATPACCAAALTVLLALPCVPPAVGWFRGCQQTHVWA